MPAADLPTNRESIEPVVGLLAVARALGDRSAARSRRRREMLRWFATIFVAISVVGTLTKFGVLRDFRSFVCSQSPIWIVLGFNRGDVFVEQGFVVENRLLGARTIPLGHIARLETRFGWVKIEFEGTRGTRSKPLSTPSTPELAALFRGARRIRVVSTGSVFE